MATLAQATQTTRTLLKWAGIVFVVFLLIRYILFPVSSALFNVFFPKEPPPPQEAFGKLPHIPFPAGQKGTGITFSIQTTTGALPTDFPDRLNVYAFVPPQVSFSSYDRAKQKVASVGFVGDGTARSPVVFVWRHPKIEGREIIVNTITDAFTLTSKSATSDPPPPASGAITIAKNFLSNMSLLPKDIDGAKTKTTFLKMQNGVVTTATSLSEASLVQVDFYRKSLEDLPILSARPTRSLISFRIIGGSDRTLQIHEAHYSYKAIDETQKSTYPIKTASDAFEELKGGQGSIVPGISLRSPVVIRNVSIAYYEDEDDIGFLLPIFVFEGDGGFLAFVEAVKTLSPE